MSLNRCTYQDLKNQALEIYYNLCRDQVTDKKSNHARILAQVDYHFDKTFNHSIEEMMFCVVELVLSGGWYQDIEEYCRRWIFDWKGKMISTRS